MEKELLHFIETPVFTRTIEKIASTEVLFELQNELIRNPEAGVLIGGCAGARKARIGDKSRNRGKSGSFRYVYLFLPKASIVYLLVFFGKNEQANLSKSERNDIAKLVRLLKGLYE